MMTPTLLFTLLFSSTSPWTPLFNGQNLDGWTIVNGDETTWVADEGKIITTGKPTGVLRTNAMYENFIIELEWRHLVENGNAGMFVWSDPIPAKGVPFTRSIEVQVMDGRELDWYTTHGDIFSIWGAQMVPDRPHPMGYQRCLPSERRSNPAPEWNHYIVTCIDGQIHLSVNGAFVSGGHNVTPRKGYICLEAEGTPAEFKNINIIELPPSSPALDLEDCANEDLGFTTLFDGLSLDGWETSAPDGWRVGDNVLNCTTGSTPLMTTASHLPYEFQFDYRCQHDSSELFVVIDGEKTYLPCNEVGSWTRFRIRGEGGPIGIGGEECSFTNLYIRTQNTQIE
jgi:hypothetical protein